MFPITSYYFPKDLFYYYGYYKKTNLFNRYELQNISLTSHMLGMLFYYPPNDRHLIELTDTLRHQDWIYDWPYRDSPLIKKLLSLLIVD